LSGHGDGAADIGVAWLILHRREGGDRK
jgi:hypothetical protein